MAIVRKYLAKEHYTKIDNQVARDKRISDYSLRLYVFMAGFKNGFQLDDEYIAKSLDWARSKVSRAKRDLVASDLIYVEKIDRSTYFLYIGNSRYPATMVKDTWHRIEDPDYQEYKQDKLEYKEREND